MSLYVPLYKIKSVPTTFRVIVIQQTIVILQTQATETSSRLAPNIA
jgi:hypothetical protein